MASSVRRFSCTGLALLMVAASGCAPEPVATVTVGLLGAPESVATVSVFVRDLERGLIVTSATVAPSRSSILLGVPAEVPLEFTVVARTDRPGPAGLGTMPGYVGSTVRTIPLGRDRQTVAITAHRAGLLTLSARRTTAGGAAGTLRVALESEHAGAKGVELEVPVDSRTWRRTLVVRTGRHTARLLTAEPAPRWQLVGGSGMHVAAELESVAPLVFAPTVAPILPAAPAALQIELTDEAGQPFEPPDEIATTGAAPTPIELRFNALDGAGQVLPRLVAPVRWSVTSTPADLFGGGAGQRSGQLASVPSTIAFLTASGTGRALVRADAVLDDGRTLSARARLNVVQDGSGPGPPTRLRLALDPPESVLVGTELSVELIDLRGMFASGFAGTVELGDSDPWVVLPAGPSAEHGAEDRGYLLRRVSRPSAPRGGSVAIHATVTSTALQSTLMSTLTLPPLAL